MRRRVVMAAVATVATLGATVFVGTASAQPPDFCRSKVSGTTYYQHDFPYQGKVAATICAPTWDVSGTAYLYARGPYANVQKYMKLEIRMQGQETVHADGRFYEEAHRYRPAGAHGYYAIMWDGSGNKIVDDGIGDVD